MYPELSEQERFPMLTSSGRALLHRMRQHPAAPIWNWPNGEQLNLAGLEKVFDFHTKLFSQSRSRNADPPEWLNDFVERCVAEVPFYRRRSKPGTPFLAIPTCSRSDLAPRVWDFVPDTAPIDELIVFSSSGTTGHPSRTPHHPYSAACGIPLMEYAMDAFCDLRFLRGPECVAITNVAAYPGAFTTAIVVSCLQEAGCIRINLDPQPWRDHNHRAAFVNAWKAPVWLGDPVAFGAIESLDIDHAPSVILSCILHLTDAYAHRLRKRYGCPVIDLYAMTEAGIIDAGVGDGHQVLSHDLWVEILDENGDAVPPGSRGEITLTGGRNPFLPLLRYRTGDFASLEHRDEKRILVGLEGRQPMEYRASNGKSIHSMEINQLVRRHPILKYSVEPLDDARYRFRVRGDVDQQRFEREVLELFGNAALIEYE